MDKDYIINEQTDKRWCWRDRLFYVFSGNIIVECRFIYTKSHEDHYVNFPEDYGVPIYRIILRNKARYVGDRVIYPPKDRSTRGMSF